MKYYAVIVGGGSGTRMGDVLPKQFHLLNGKPVLMQTIQAFFNSELKPEIVVVLNIDFHRYWQKLCLDYQFDIPHTLVQGGSERFYSVKNSLDYISEDAIVAIHDAVRPLVSNKLIRNSFQEAKLKGNAVCALQSADSVRIMIAGNVSAAAERQNIYLVQTPQVFEIGMLKSAYSQPYRADYTDDASVVESSGTAINLIEGDKTNIKITFPADLAVAEVLIKMRE